MSADSARFGCRAGYYGCIAAFLTLDFQQCLHRISIPTLFVRGADDHRGGPAPIMQDLGDAVPGAKHVTVPNAGHICNLQNEDGFNESLGDFLRAQAV